jgi:hypothetical protein
MENPSHALNTSISITCDSNNISLLNATDVTVAMDLTMTGPSSVDSAVGGECNGIINSMNSNNNVNNNNNNSNSNIVEAHAINNQNEEQNYLNCNNNSNTIDTHHHHHHNHHHHDDHNHHHNNDNSSNNTNHNHRHQPTSSASSTSSGNFSTSPSQQQNVFESTAFSQSYLCTLLANIENEISLTQQHLDDENDKRHKYKVSNQI